MNVNPIFAPNIEKYIGMKLKSQEGIIYSPAQ